MTRRGFLVKPDPALVEPCARPGCAHPEGKHLICGCQSTPHGEPCRCPGFALPAPTCPHCGQVFDFVWKFDAHLRFRTPACLERERDDAEKQRAREFRAKQKASV